MRRVFLFLSSLRLTVALLALSMLLVFLATLAQEQWGVYEIQRRYFESLGAVWRYPAHWAGGELLSAVPVPLPGGFLLGVLLLVNLACAHFRFFRPGWRRAGIALLHAGVVLLIVSGFATAYFQEEYFMWLPVGGESRHIESFRDLDLVVVDRTDPAADVEISFPAGLLRAGAELRHPALPFALRPLEFFRNTHVGLRSREPRLPELRATRGVAANRDLSFVAAPYDYARDNSNIASATVAVETPEGPLGAWLVSTLFEPSLSAQVPPIFTRGLPQTFEHAGRVWEIVLRPRREYLPFALRLDRFIHEKYAGTEIPKHFESQVQLLEPPANSGRPVRIYMNHPLRHGGLTFYQASFAPGGDASMLQVVRNPGWTLPYFAVAMVGVGMLLQFLLSFAAHLRKVPAPAPAAAAAPRAPVGENAAVR